MVGYGKISARSAGLAGPKPVWPRPGEDVAKNRQGGLAESATEGDVEVKRKWEVERYLSVKGLRWVTSRVKWGSPRAEKARPDWPTHPVPLQPDT